MREVHGEGEWLGDVVSPKRSGEGQKSDEAEKDEGGEERARLDFLDEIEELMLQHPESRGDGEADSEGDPISEGLPQRMGQLTVRDACGDFDFEDEQGHRDGEDAVREGFDPVLAVHGVTIVFDCGPERKLSVL